MIQSLWALLILFNLLTFCVALVNYAHGLRTGCLCVALNLVDTQNGLIILRPNPNGPAAGLIQDGDVLLAVDGMTLAPGTSPSQAIVPIDNQAAGTPLTLTVQTGEAPARDVTLVRDSGNWLIGGAILLGMPFQAAYIYALALEIVIMGVTLFVVGLIAWRRADDWMALYAALAMMIAMIIFGQALPNLDNAANSFRVLYFIAGSTLALGFGLLFPDGRFRPRWTLLLLIVYPLWSAAINFDLLSPLASTAGNLVLAVLYSALFVHRFRSFMTPTQRQQTKWAGLGIVIAFLSNTLYPLSLELVRNAAPLDTLRLFFFFVYPLSTLLTLALPLGFAFAMLRYRLYDVDLAINRGLVYGLVTLGLGALFVAIFWGAQAALGALWGAEQAGAAIAVSAAVTALLFNPARKRVQHVIDRRFYGFRFDLNELAAGQKMPAVKNPGLLTGRTLGSYQVLGVLGRGGMGEVYQGVGAGQTVALKILPAELAGEDAFRRRFAREAQTLASLDHPNIVKVYSSGESDGVIYMAMEFVQGRELSAWLQERSQFSLAETRQFVQDCAAALDYAHGQGLVHRDIKPSNIMLREAQGRLQAVLMDFGIAKIRDARTALTGTGAVGTIDYMAPEQILAAKEVDHRADIYALGVVLYEMLTGDKPFKGSAGQVLFAHLQQPPPDPRATHEHIPAAAAQAVLRALAKNPDDRYSSVGELAAALA
ncbi:MAG: protein kinase [Chloroflexi bacterium]|nr:protein kinase [Chloroflexota bacterium]